MITNNSELSPREYEEMKHQKEMLKMQSEHALAIKGLEVEQLKIESKFASWLKIPLVIITLPVRIVLAFGLVIKLARKEEVDFSQLIK